VVLLGGAPVAQDLRRRCAARLFFGTIPDDPISFRDVSFYADPALHFASLSQIKSELHSHQVFHLRPERFLDPQAHLTRKRRFLIQQVRKRLPPTPSTFAAWVTVSPRGSITSRRIKPPTCGGFFIAIISDASAIRVSFS
jgi:hypothetical protein